MTGLNFKLFESCHSDMFVFHVDDKETKLSRRTSYLMATRQTVSLSSAPENKSSAPNMTQSQLSPAPYVFTLSVR